MGWAARRDCDAIQPTMGPMFCFSCKIFPPASVTRASMPSMAPFVPK